MLVGVVIAVIADRPESYRGPACYATTGTSAAGVAGLESAIIAHVVTHVLLWSATRAGMYF